MLPKTKSSHLIKVDHFPLPKNFFEKVEELEVNLTEGSLNHDGMKELFELYSLGTSHFEARGMVTEFEYYIVKMQELPKHPNIQKLLSRRKSRELVVQMHSDIEKLQQKEKIKQLLKDTNKTTKKDTNDILLNLSKTGQNNDKIINEDLSNQEESFKKRLEQKKFNRSNSEKKILVNNKIKEVEIESDSENITLKQSVSLMGTPLKNNFMNKGKESKFSAIRKKLNLEIETNIEPPVINTNTINNQVDVNEIFDDEYYDTIESSINTIWEAAEASMQEELKRQEQAMEKFLDEMAEEKFSKTMEINNKYDAELKSLEQEIDKEDENNINNIIYNEVKADRDKELKTAYEEIEKKKKRGLAQLREQTNKIKTEFNEKRKINEIKEKINKNLKNKVIKSLTPKNVIGRTFNLKNINLNDSNDSASENEEDIDYVGEDDITLNPIKKGERKPKSKNSPNIFSKQNKRVSHGILGILKDKKDPESFRAISKTMLEENEK